jgi:hypothetical protein
MTEVGMTEVGMTEVGMTEVGMTEVDCLAKAGECSPLKTETLVQRRKIMIPFQSAPQDILKV